MTTTPATFADVLRKLAEADVECLYCQGIGQYQMLNRPEPGFTRRCSPCSGTGRVPLFRDVVGKALLRKVCSGLWVVVSDKRPEKDLLGRMIPRFAVGTVLGSSMASISSSIQAIQRHGMKDDNCCGGLRWLPLTEAEATIDLALAAARSRGWQVYLDSSPRGCACVIYKDDARLSSGQDDAGRERETCWRALYTAMEVTPYV